MFPVFCLLIALAFAYNPPQTPKVHSGAQGASSKSFLDRNNPGQVRKPLSPVKESWSWVGAMLKERGSQKVSERVSLQKNSIQNPRLLVNV